MVEKTRHRKIPEIVSWSETVACKGANLCISYDAQNRRVYRKADEDQSGSQETELYYVLDGNRVIEERVYSDEDLKRDYWYGVYIDNPVFGRCDLNDDNDFSDTDEQFYYLHNTQYSVHAIVDTSGSIIEVYKNYQPYGAVDVYTGDGGDSDWWDGDETTGSLSSNYYLFTGRRYDPEADLMFYRNRMYSTGRGRFLQRDPIGYVDGLNLYRAYFVPGGVDFLGKKTTTTEDQDLDGMWLTITVTTTTVGDWSEWNRTEPNDGYWWRKGLKYEYLGCKKCQIIQVEGWVDLIRESRERSYQEEVRDDLYYDVNEVSNQGYGEGTELINIIIHGKWSSFSSSVISDTSSIQWQNRVKSVENPDKTRETNVGEAFEVTGPENCSGWLSATPKTLCIIHCQKAYYT